MIAHGDVAHRRVLFYPGERFERRQEIIIRRIVIGERDFAGQDGAAFGPEGMGDERFKRQAFARLQRHARTRREIEHFDIFQRLKAIVEPDARRIHLKQFDDETRPAAVQNVFGLDNVKMMRRALSVFRHHRFFGIEPAAGRSEAAPVAHANREKAKAFPGIGAGLEFDDIPAEPRLANTPGGGRRRKILRFAPQSERRQFEAMALAKFEHRIDAAIDEGTAHRAASRGLKRDGAYFTPAVLARSIPARTSERASSASPHLVILTHLLGSRSL